MKGQLSAEMLILIAVVLAVVAIAAMQMLGSAKSTSDKIENQTENVGRITDAAVKSQEGEYCFEVSDCRSGLSCNGDTHRCE